MTSSDDFWSRIFKISLLLLTSAPISVCGQNNFVPVDVESPSGVDTPVRYLDDGQSSEVLVCPTIRDGLHFLLEPRNNTGDGTFQYKLLNGSFNLTFRREACVNRPGICDQLVMVHVPGAPERGEFLIRYLSSSFQLFVRVAFGPPLIESPSSLPITVNRSSGLLFFTYRSLQDANRPPMFDVCDASRNGSTSAILGVSNVLPNRSCTPAAFSSTNGLNNVALFIMMTDERMLQERVQVVRGSCPGTPGDLKSALIDVIYEVPGVPTVMMTSVATTASATQGPDRPLGVGAIIGIAVGGVAAIGLIVVVVVVVVSIMCVRYEMETGLGDIALHRQSPTLVRSGHEGTVNSYEEMPNGRNLVAETQNKDLSPKETVDGDEREEEKLDFTVRRLAFVTPDSSNQFQELEHALLQCHHCDRAHPVVGGEEDVNQILSIGDLELQVSNWLKEDCLVYIIWAGSLENLDDNSCIKQMVRQFWSRPMRDKNNKASVMHRLVFLQLGYGRNAKTIEDPNNSLWVFKESQPSDDNFNPKQCGQEVCNAVQDRLLKMASIQNQPRQGGAATVGTVTNAQLLKGVQVLLDRHEERMVGTIQGQEKRIKGRIDQRADGLQDAMATKELAETQELGEMETLEEEVEEDMIESRNHTVEKFSHKKNKK